MPSCGISAGCSVVGLENEDRLRTRTWRLRDATRRADRLGPEDAGPGACLLAVWSAAWVRLEVFVRLQPAVLVPWLLVKASASG